MSFLTPAEFAISFISWALCPLVFCFLVYNPWLRQGCLGLHQQLYLKSSFSCPQFNSVIFYECLLFERLLFFYKSHQEEKVKFNNKFNKYLLIAWCMQSPMPNNANFERRNKEMEVGRAFQDNQTKWWLRELLRINTNMTVYIDVDI